MLFSLPATLSSIWYRASSPCLPHDPNAFTEGLILVDGDLYESTGRYGRSALQETDPDTGAVLRSVSLPADDFGEGLALVGDHLVQLTWMEGHRLRLRPRYLCASAHACRMADEGWGMCYDGAHLYTSNGSAALTMRDADTLAALDTLPVTLDDEPVQQINELECVGDSIYANVWHTDNILRIDKSSGRVTAVIDASGLLTPEQRASLNSGEAVLNGIAYDAENGTFHGDRQALVVAVRGGVRRAGKPIALHLCALKMSCGVTEVMPGVAVCHLAEVLRKYPLRRASSTLLDWIDSKGKPKWH